MFSWALPCRRMPWLFLALTLFCGCGGSPFSDVSGNVSFDGQPVNKGSISFLPADGRGPTAAAVIEQGRFSVRVLPGEFKVQICSYRKIGERHASEGDPASPIIDIDQQTLPDRFNTATTLTREIKAGRQQVDFPLTSETAKR
jgi:hypothetical protein